MKRSLWYVSGDDDATMMMIFTLMILVGQLIGDHDYYIDDDHSMDDVF